jgi:hypothetical protein
MGIVWEMSNIEYCQLRVFFFVPRRGEGKVKQANILNVQPINYYVCRRVTTMVDTPIDTRIKVYWSLYVNVNQSSQPIAKTHP